MNRSQLLKDYSDTFQHKLYSAIHGGYKSFAAFSQTIAVSYGFRQEIRDKRLYWYRDFKILDTDRNPLGKGSTAWFVIDLETRKPQRADRLHYTLPEGFERMFPARPGKVPRPQPGEPVFSVQAGYRHLDVNQHVNNVKYLQWMLEGLDLTFHENHNLHTFEVNYLNEGGYGDNVVVIQQPLSELSFLHSLQHAETGTEICRAKTVWQPIDEA